MEGVGECLPTIVSVSALQAGPVGLVLTSSLGTEVTWAKAQMVFLVALPWVLLLARHESHRAQLPNGRLQCLCMLADSLLGLQTL